MHLGSKLKFVAVHSPTCFMGTVVGGRTLGWEACGLSDSSDFMALTGGLVPMGYCLPCVRFTLSPGPEPLPKATLAFHPYVWNQPKTLNAT